MYKNHRIYAITYGDKNYSMSRSMNCITARMIGRVDNCTAFKEGNIDEEFYEAHKTILDAPRGGGTGFGNRT